MNHVQINAKPILALWVIALAAKSASAQFSFTDLSAAGFGNTDLRGLSPDGKTILGSTFPRDLPVPYYIQNGVGTQLPLGGFGNGVARSRSSDGTIVGQVLVGSNEVFGEGAVWRNGVLSLLEHSPGGAFADARAISADNHVIVGNATLANSLTQPARWVDGHVEPLGDIPGSNSIGTALAVSADGSVVVGEAGGNVKPFRWMNGVMEALPLINPADIDDSTAFDVSADGRRIVGTQLHFSFLTDALLWEDGAVRNLGYLPGANKAIASAISADGTLVFGNSGTGFTFRAYVWDEDHGMQDLMQLLANAGVDLHGWSRLNYIYDVSADGHTILGYGFNAQGFYSPFLATIPEPGTLSLAAVSFVLFGMRRGRGRADSIHPEGAFESSHGASPW